MQATPVRTILAAAVLAAAVHVSPAEAAAPKLEGSIEGIELAPQSLAGAAIFVFEYRGKFDGRFRKGWGWVAVVHQDLPDEEGESSLILGGEGELYIGFRRFEIDVLGGLLTLANDHGTPEFDDDFQVTLLFDVCNTFGQCRQHGFDGLLSHQPRVPTINGAIAPLE